MLLAPAVWAQSTPHFTLPQRFLQPDRALEIYGDNLGPSPGCGVQLPAVAPFPTEACGVIVTVGGIPAGLRYVGPKQINIDVPQELPDGPAAVQVCIDRVCSEPLVKDISSHTALLRAVGTLYVGMPMWIEVAAPDAYAFVYLCSTDPWNLHCGAAEYQMEVRRDGVPLAPAPRPKIATANGIPPIFGTRPAQFPLHLAYRIGTPGTYSLRLTEIRDGKVVVQSGWTDIEVRPYSVEAREAWLARMEERVRAASMGELIGDIVPSLLSSPDVRSLQVLLPVYSAWLGKRGYINQEIFVASFLRNSLSAFDPDLLRRMLPPDIWR